MKPIRLHFVKESTSKDQPGFIYLHNFGTGVQELVFPSHDAALKFANENGTGISIIRPLLMASTKATQTVSY